jgi:NDP-sugar pyrophosphorylase family protein
MNDINLLPEEALGLGFVPPEYLAPGEDEYRIRNEQLAALGRKPDSYRRLRPFEIEALVKNANTCRDWNDLLVSDPFTPELVKNSAFAGLVRLGRLEKATLEHHDTRVLVGIYNSRIIACDIGENCAILDCSILAHYIVGDGCMLINNDEIETSSHAKFGNGILKEGEAEEVRIELDLMNEAGGRSVWPFDGMWPADAYLWARRRGEADLLAAFKTMTTAMFDTRRGRYGTIGAHSILKSNRIIKDTAIGACAYIKGANKLKNLTINSSDEARTQIGEGVELVNGIIGYGCRVFYGCKAVRFVMGDNSALKYGARLIHSVLGENSTVSCCEILNNLIFPSHEQHHNTSFLIASLVRGQSNMAAGATIGSNHNSRANDGEIEAGRGFWPGLSTSVKHSSRFASYCLLAKGDYRAELNLPLPFCLVDDDRTRDRLVLVPAYWWTHDLYALLRNESKFLSRDRRVNKKLLIEYSPFAPDTAEEIIAALSLIEGWMGRAVLMAQGLDTAEASRETLETAGRRALADPSSLPPAEIEADGIENSARPTILVKPARAWKAYREILLWYAGSTLITHAVSCGFDACIDSGVHAIAAGSPPLPETGLHAALEAELGSDRRVAAWENLGGQLVPLGSLDALLGRVAAGELATWREMHDEYGRFASSYPLEKTRHAWAVLAWLQATAKGEGAPSAEASPRLDKAGLAAALAELSHLADRVEEGVYRSRKKDFDNPFRRATFRSGAEAAAVVGSPERNAFVLKTRKEAALLRTRAQELASRL